MRSKYYKTIKRDFYDNDMNYLGNATFIANGQWADGHLSYELLDTDQFSYEYQEYQYAQVRHNGKLVMVIV